MEVGRVRWGAVAPARAPILPKTNLGWTDNGMLKVTLVARGPQDLDSGQAKHGHALCLLMEVTTGALEVAAAAMAACLDPLPTLLLKPLLEVLCALD